MIFLLSFDIFIHERAVIHMIKNERKDKILALVKSKGYVTLEEIANYLDISESTVRRDIVEMDSDGLLIRERGGASSLKTNTFPMIDQKLIIRERLESESKLKIAKQALSLIENDSTIFLDAGSSTLALARILPQGMRITVVTDSLTIARTVSEKGINTYLIGGILKLTTDATVGPMAEEELSKFHFKQAFMGANAIDPELGFMTPDFSEASLKKVAVKCSEQVYFLVDSTKFNNRSVISFASLSGNYAITDFVDTASLFGDLKIMGVN